MGNEDFQQVIASAIGQLKSQRSSNVAFAPQLPKPPNVTAARVSNQTELDDIKQRQELTQNDKRFDEEMKQRANDRELKKRIATQVFGFLAVETTALFIVILLQGFRPFSFHLEDSTINIFLGATLLQISMAVIITRHLYPTSDKQ